MTRTLWDEMRKLQREMESLFSTAPLLESPLTIKANYRRPLADYSENNKEVDIHVELPGVNKKDIKVNLTEDGVEIKVERKTEVEKKDKTKGFYRYERSYSGFYRYFSLPANADKKRLSAKYKDGVLHLQVPKTKAKLSKKTTVQVK